MADTKRKNRFGSGNGGDISAAIRQNTALREAAGIKATYSDGVLRVTLPKHKEVPASTRRLETE